MINAVLLVKFFLYDLLKYSTYRAVIASLLAFLVLHAVVLKKLHHMLDHHHAEVVWCESTETHLHSEEYAPLDCFVCFFHFSPIEQENDDSQTINRELPAAVSYFTYQSACYIITHRQLSLCGPPVLFA